MKTILAALSMVAVVCNPFCHAAAVKQSSSSSSSSFRPLQISWDDLQEKNGGSSMLDALTQAGIVSVTNMPKRFRQSKHDVLSWTHPCAVESPLTIDHVYTDGTRRRTMATNTVPGSGGVQVMDHGADPIASCEEFDNASLPFRQGVDEMTRSFAEYLTDLLREKNATTSALLMTRQGFVFETIQDVVSHGEHLEHFHSYQKQMQTDESDQVSTSTIGWHTDQGLFLVFTPGLMVHGNQIVGQTDGFSIELPGGTRTILSLDHTDDVVILMGDGVNQYVNPSLKTEKLWAVPHSLTMPSSGDNSMALVWYGRMVLPPSSAVHPAHRGMTFGAVRDHLINGAIGDESDKHEENILALGCSSPSLQARQLETTSCDQDSLLCWHKCMSLDEYSVSADICQDQGLDLRCINPRQQLWDDSHGDWYPGCINASAAETGTPYPTLPDYPRDDETCSDEAFDAYVITKAATYEHMANLTAGGVLLWSVVDGQVDGMLSYNGLFGYTALGFKGLAGDNAMQGATIIMATPSDSYSAVTGFDFSGEHTVQEYIIDPHPDHKSFRFWMTPVSSTTRSIVSNANGYGVEETDCFTSMTFSTAGIFNKTFNLNGTDDLIWAANGVDSFAGYHGTSRGIIQVNWATGEVTLQDHDHEGDDHDEGDHEEDVPSASASTSTTSVGAASATIAAIIFVYFTFGA